MEDVEKLFARTVDEIEKMLNSKTVIGEPITVEGSTLIPLVSVGFGFAAGGGKGTDRQKAAGQGGASGGGGGVKPVALIVANRDGVRVDPVKSGAASVFDKAIETLGAVAQKKNNGSPDTE